MQNVEMTFASTPGKRISVSDVFHSPWCSRSCVGT